MVENFEYLKKHTYINEVQLHFIQTYPFPFTVLLNTKRDFILDEIPNKTKYRKTAFRIANLEVQQQLLKKI
jgi:tRNA A37 threonylcarbamoyladenosine synthetase subunit TsaC/SUA5/YrdC